MKTLQIEELLLHNDRILSRTVANRQVNTGVSVQKKPLVISADALELQIRKNIRMVADFIEILSRATPSAYQINAAFYTIGFLTNHMINANSLLRQWDYVPPLDRFDGDLVPPDLIEAGLWEQSSALVNVFRDSEDERRYQLIAGVEWEIGVGPIHPFSDGCGRVSRYISAAVCVCCDLEVVLHRSRDVYMAAARGGKQRFVEYWVRQIIY